MKPKLLCILHRSPPSHGASKVGDFIASSKKLNASYECRFITIKSSDTIGDIGRVNFKKIYLVAELYAKVIWALLVFRPQKIYFTASIQSVALYRDVLISTLWKAYKLLKPIEVFYHYHTKGIDEFVSVSILHLKLTRFFLKNVNLILLSPLLKKDFEKVQTFNKVFFLPNGVKDYVTDKLFNKFVVSKYVSGKPLEILFLSNMMKSKGYFNVIELANMTKDQQINYHFAGNWQYREDKDEFFDFIEQNELSEKVTFHGFVKGEEKQSLLKKAHLLIFPTRYKAESFGLVIIEAMSNGVPVISTDEGSIPYILDEKSGIIIDDINKLPEALEQAKQKLLNKETAMYCRQRYLNFFNLEQFEDNLIEILNRKQDV